MVRLTRTGRTHVLVTGASGFIGRHLSSVLARAGYGVTAVSRAVGTDVTNWSDVEKIEQADVVCHLAGMTRKDVGPRETYRVNWLGTLNLLEYSCVHKIQRLIFASSYVYGEPRYLPVDEKHPLLGEGPYAKSKIFAEELCEAYSRQHGVSVVILRIFNAYGPEQKGEMLIPTILSQLMKSGDVVLRDPSPCRDFVYVEDVAQAFLAAICGPSGGFRCYNVSSGRSVSVGDVVREIAKDWGNPFSVRYTGERLANEIMDCVGSNAMIAQELGWTPKMTLEEGIRRTVEWWKINH